MTTELQSINRPSDGGGAMELVSQGAALIRIENETMMQVAVQRPRDESAVISGALRELDLVPEEAGKAFYSIPFRERQADGSYKIVKVEGPSVKAALALARRWGNCTVSARILHEDADGFDVEGVFIDLETNFRVMRPQRVSKSYKTRSGAQMVLTVDRQLQAVQAGASKCMRNAALNGLPAYLVSAYDRKARAIVSGNLDAPADAKTIDAVVRAFAKWQVTQAQLEQYAELSVAQWTGTQVADLRGLWNAISDGQTQVAEVWPTQPDPSVPSEPAVASASGSPSPEPAGTPEVKAAPGPISEGQLKRLWAIARGSLWSQDDVHEYIKREHQLDSTAAITVAIYDAICDHVKMHPHKPPAAA